MEHEKPNDTTHFGYEQVPIDDKSRRVADVFHSVASKYDVMNDLMSLGVHRLWKRIAIEFVAARPGQRILDLAGGTGDLAAAIAPRVGDTGEVVLADINESMLRGGRDRLIDKGLVSNVRFVQADAEKLPFPDNYFDCITIAFGLRNVTDKATALASMRRPNQSRRVAPTHPAAIASGVNRVEALFARKRRRYSARAVSIR